MKKLLSVFVSCCLLSCHKDPQINLARPASFTMQAYYVRANWCLTGMVAIDVRDADLRKYMMSFAKDTGQRDIFFFTCIGDSSEFLFQNPNYKDFDTFDITIRYPKGREGAFTCTGDWTFPFSLMYVTKIKKH
ncbi:hypothetical protein [Pedobacter chitinilyticus]|uniref:Uncharacterized protein n=1 Tax=Pedobacter chitinilyticus TaxID=2233776 RepID=A0A3S3PC47_9SPHI|nr:hypothetical protein [Pedobacter chitinilyticus]RWU08195.1 hypothetical protein DPV69_07375 [Pedobacter chitinilyticus]